MSHPRKPEINPHMSQSIHASFHPKKVFSLTQHSEFLCREKFRATVSWPDPRSGGILLNRTHVLCGYESKGDRDGIADSALMEEYLRDMID